MAHQDRASTDASRFEPFRFRTPSIGARLRRARDSSVFFHRGPRRSSGRAGDRAQRKSEKHVDVCRWSFPRCRNLAHVDGGADAGNRRDERLRACRARADRRQGSGRGGALSRELILVARRLESPVRTQAAVAARHVRMASSRKTRSVRRDVRWRWTSKVLRREWTRSVELIRAI